MGTGSAQPLIMPPQLPPTPKYKSVDDIFNAVGPWNWYQWMLTIIYGYHFTIVTINDGFMSFAGMRPTMQCMDDPSNAYAYNNTEVPAKDTYCDMYRNCSKGNFSLHSPFYTIVQQYELVCDRDNIVGYITSLQFFGIMIGAILSGPVVDYFGRKPTFLFFVLMEICLGCLVTLAPNWEIHAAFRFVIGFFAGADMNAGWVFLGEFTTNKYRFLFRALAIIIPKFMFPIVGWLTKDWVWLELVGNLVCLPLLVIIPLYCHESPRWLIQKGRLEEANRVFWDVARHNGRRDFRIEPSEIPSPPVVKYAPIWKLFDSLPTAKNTIVAAVTWFVASLVNYGIFFDLGNLPFDVYITQIILAVFYIVFELPFAILDMRYPKINRRFLILGFIAFATGMNLLIAAMYYFGLAETHKYDVLFSLAANFGHSAIWMVFDLAYVLQVELFPTLLRSSAGSLCSCSARLGAIVAPLLINLENGCLTCSAIPYVAFAGVGVLGFVVDWFLLPNTKNAVLMETLEDASLLPSPSFAKSPDALEMTPSKPKL